MTKLTAGFLIASVVASAPVTASPILRPDTLFVEYEGSVIPTGESISGRLWIDIGRAGPNLDPPGSGGGTYGSTGFGTVYGEEQRPSTIVPNFITGFLPSTTQSTDRVTIANDLPGRTPSDSFDFFKVEDSRLEGTSNYSALIVQVTLPADVLSSGSLVQSFTYTRDPLFLETGGTVIRPRESGKPLLSYLDFVVNKFQVTPKMCHR
jgi:hypothetical protein